MHVDLSNLRPMDDRIVLRRLEQNESSIIAIPDIAQKGAHYGEVLAVGPGRRMKGGWRKPVEVVPGQKVFYQSSDLDFGDLILITERDILVIETDA